MKSKFLVSSVCAAAMLAPHPSLAATNITENVTLAEDADWRDRGTVTISEGVTLDLGGHALYVRGLAGSGTLSGAVTPCRYACFKYYRFRIDATAGAALQLSEIKLFNGDADITQNSTVLWDDTSFNATFRDGFNPAKAVDGDLDTKWYDDRAEPGHANSDKVWVTLAFSEPTTVTRYQWFTADDSSSFPKRNPKSWRIQGSDDNEEWTNLDVVTDATPPAVTKELAYEKALIMEPSKSSTLHVDVSGGASYDNFTGNCSVPVCVGDGVLAGDCDLRRFGSSATVTGIVNLAGHTMRLSGLSGSGTITSGEPNGYRFYRFKVDATGGNDFQISRIDFLCGNSNITDQCTALHWRKDNYPSDFNPTYNPEAALDGSTATKWYDNRAKDDIWVTLEYAEPALVTQYRWYTGDDTKGAPARNPTAWRLQASNDNATWTDLDVVTGATPPAANKTLAYIGYVNSNLGGDGGELHVEVREGACQTNSTVTLSGRLKLVKDGAGTLVCAKAGQSYGGGTTVAAGFLKPGMRNDASLFGVANPSIAVEDGGQFLDDIFCEGVVGDVSWSIAGAGPDGFGAIRATARAPAGVNNAGVSWGRSLTLTGDATIGSDEYAFDFIAPDYIAYPIALNGHTLTLKSSQPMDMREYPFFLAASLCGTDAGTIVVGDNLCFYPYPGNAIVLPNVTFVVSAGAEYHTNKDPRAQDMTVSNLVYRSASAISQTERTTTVLGTYTPASATSAPKVQLGDATHLSPTLDLSSCIGTFDADFGGGLTFTEGTTVSVRVGNRKVPRKVIGWADGTGPTSVKFVFADTDRKLSVKSDGVYRAPGFIMLVK